MVTAAGKGDLAKVKALLNQGANINGSSYTIWNNPLMTAIEEGRANVVEYLLEKGAFLKPKMLGQAAGSGYVEIVQILIRHGADVNYTDEYGHNAIHWATINRIEHPRDQGHIERNRKLDKVIQILKAAGAR